MTPRTTVAVPTARLGATRVRRWGAWGRLWLSDRVGGAARLRVIVLLAAVLGLQSADAAAVGAVAPSLESDLHMTNTQLGLLVTASTAVGALAALPAGMLVDRISRVRLLSGAVGCWAVAMALSGLATSYAMLLITRLALGVVIATAGPAVASLTGDLFPARERGRIFGFILTGELLGSGLGYLVSGNLAGLVSWRASFIALAVPAVLLSIALLRLLPEPARGGQSRIAVGAERILGAAQATDPPSCPEQEEPPTHTEEGMVEAQIRRADISPRLSQVLDRDPTHMRLRDAVRYVLSIRTNVLLIITSAIGYFFYAGLTLFALEFLRGRFGLGQSVASTLLVLIGSGSILGVLVGGRIADRRIARGHVAARPLIAGAAFLLTATILVPGLLAADLLIAGPLLFLGAAANSATNPGLDAARLDVMQHHLWGRAEAIRTTLRSTFTAAAPLVFGYVSTRFGGGTVGLAGATGSDRPSGAQIAASNADALDHTFLVMLIPLVLAGTALMLAGPRTYPRDVATAMASEKLTMHGPAARPLAADSPGLGEGSTDAAAGP
jgi:predicted MFS family arabinose efflux permease